MDPYTLLIAQKRYDQLTKLEKQHYKLRKLEEAAVYFADGHYTLIRFTKGWGCALGTVSTPDEVRNELYNGETMEEAIDKCLQDIPEAKVVGDMCYWMAKDRAKAWAEKEGNPICENY